GTRSRGPDRALASAGSLRQPVAAADREPDRCGQARQAPLGCPQDPRAPGPPTGRRHPRSGQEHDPPRTLVCSALKFEFATDPPLEGDGFELLVPPGKPSPVL